MDKVEDYYKTIKINMRRLDSLFKERLDYKNHMTKSENLDTYLFGNESQELEQLNKKIGMLLDENLVISSKLVDLGWSIKSWDYELSRFDKNKMHGVNAMYNFRVEYDRCW